MKATLFTPLALTIGLTVPAFADDTTPATDAPSNVAEEVANFDAAWTDPSSPFDELAAPGVERRHTIRHVRALKKVKEVCARVKASDEQLATIKDAVLSYKATAIPLEASAKLAKLNYVRNVLSDAGDANVAAATAKEGITAKSELMLAKSELGTKILFDILKKEQRRDGLKCLMAIKKLKQLRHHRHDLWD